MSPLVTPSSTGASEGALAPYVRAVRAHPWLIVLISAVAVATGLFWVATRSHSYTASSQVLVTPLSNDGSYAGLPILTDSVDPTRTLQTAASVLQSPAASDAAAGSMPGWTSRRVADAVAVEPQGESNVVTVTATADSPEAAAKLANAYTESTLTLRGRNLRDKAAGSIASLQAQQKSVPASDTATSQQIASELSSLERIRDGQDPNFSLLQPASASAATATGSPASLVLALALIAGLALGLGAALALEHLNRRVRDEEDLLALYPLPVLARVPPLPRGSGDPVMPEMVPPRVQEAFRTLQIQLQGGAEQTGRVVLVTSPSMGDGKTTSALNLAMALTLTRASVLLIDLDLRKPDLGHRLGVDGDASALLGRKGSLVDALRPAPGAPGLEVLAARAQPNVIPLLEAVTRRIPQLLAEARELADWVIIDTPPLGEVSDALRMAGAVDDVVLVVRPGHTDRDALLRSRELLERMGHEPTGLLVVGETPAGTTHYGYGGAPTGSEPATLSPLMALEPLEPAHTGPVRPSERRRESRS